MIILATLVGNNKTIEIVEGFLFGSYLFVGGKFILRSGGFSASRF